MSCAPEHSQAVYIHSVSLQIGRFPLRSSTAADAADQSGGDADTADNRRLVLVTNWCRLCRVWGVWPWCNHAATSSSALLQWYCHPEQPLVMWTLCRVVLSCQDDEKLSNTFSLTLIVQPVSWTERSRLIDEVTTSDYIVFYHISQHLNQPL